ncbi:hypothetical protein [Paenibacillus sp. OSY-SE]|uniref:hypothetical protein n=1 Tax=Paenibacillus sp. OSY-SE TaxID=1196323 RepID=UPI003078F5B0
MDQHGIEALTQLDQVWPNIAHRPERAVIVQLTVVDGAIRVMPPSASTLISMSAHDTAQADADQTRFHPEPTLRLPYRHPVAPMQFPSLHRIDMQPSPA